ncbi:MAG TPA: FkbM family methyltransferase [Saprospiraceae bacterium]|nr:FkbM family methyltransferase [Saprospiraceae bacterium]HQW55271.1 FkbM family methyltransferase [Saprospiraceae bacterium]
MHRSEARRIQRQPTRKMKDLLLKQLNKVEQIANFSKIGRFLHQPFKYGSAILHRILIYPYTKKEIEVTTEIFFGREMHLALPASIDIYLTGGKSHSSEIRLARYLILSLRENDHFLDIGAHFGYFTLLANQLVGVGGQIISIEPSSKSFKLLRQNVDGLKNIRIYQKAVSNTTEPITFYEFPNLHSEYNTSDVTQFENDSWYRQSPPVKVTVEATTIDELVKTGSFCPHIIKMDVEGAEYQALQGGINFLCSGSPQVIMEYVEPKRKNENHKKSMDLLLSLGYVGHVIQSDGSLQAIIEVDSYLTRQGLESDNLVFIKAI